MKTVHLEYYAILRDERGCQSEAYETNAESLTALYEELQKRHSFSPSISMMRVAVNDDFVEWDADFKSEDEVVFIPPVSGG